MVSTLHMQALQTKIFIRKPTIAEPHWSVLAHARTHHVARLRSSQVPPTSSNNVLTLGKACISSTGCA